MTAFEILVCGLLIAASAFMSGTEIALFSLSRFQLRAIRERAQTSHRIIKKLVSDPGGLLVVILVLNEAINIGLAAVVTGAISRGWGAENATLFRWLNSWLAHYVPEWAIQTIAGTILITPIVLVFCEITPKVIAARANHAIAPLAAPPMHTIYRAMSPIRTVLMAVVRLASHALGKDVRDHGVGKPLLREEEFLVMLEEGHKEGALQEAEMELIQNVFQLDDTQAQEICTPMPEVYTIAAGTSVKAASEIVRKQRYSRIPVLKPGTRQVMGMLYAKDLLLARVDSEIDPDASIESILRKPYVVAPSLRLNALFRRFKQNRTHIAVIESKSGEALGIVTMTDVLEALFEDILEPDGQAGQNAQPGRMA